MATEMSAATSGGGEAPPVFGRLSLGKVDLRIVLLVVLTVFLSLAGAYRWLGTTPDFVRYNMSYSNLPYDHPAFYTRFEPGYVWTAWFFKYILNTNIQFYFFVLIAASLAVKFTLIWKWTSYPFLACFLYMITLYLNFEYTQIRAAIGLDIGFIGVYFALQRKYFIASVFLCTAAFFHYSTIVLTVSVIAFFLAWERPKVAGLVIASIVIVISLSQVSELFGNYFRDFALYNPMVARNLLAVAADVHAKVDLFSAFNTLYYLGVLSCGIFLTPWKEKTASLLFFFSVLGVVVMFAFRQFPEIAGRLQGVFLLATFVLPLRASLRGVRVIPAVILNMHFVGWLVVSFLGVQIP